MYLPSGRSDELEKLENLNFSRSVNSDIAPLTILVNLREKLGWFSYDGLASQYKMGGALDSMGKGTAFFTVYPPIPLHCGRSR